MKKIAKSIPDKTVTKTAIKTVTPGSAPGNVTPDYWLDACRHLVAKDRVMKRLIPQFGDASLQSRGEYTKNQQVLR